MLKTIVAAVVALVLAGLAGAAPQAETYRLTSILSARAEVPKPKDVARGVSGRFTGTAVELANDRGRLTWRLTFARLSGRAAAAHVHSGRPGKAGPVLVPLCGPCRNGQRGSFAITRAQLRTIRTGRTYVNVHTAANLAGEIRGQIKVRVVSGDGGSGGNPPPPSPAPEPPPYPPYP
jgi:CHRD domain